MKKIVLLFITLFTLYFLNLSAQNWTSNFVNTGGGTVYDLASNSSPQWIAQDPAKPDNIHTIIMSVPLGDPSTYPNRRTKYYFSSDRGVTWVYTGSVLDRKSGFCSIQLVNDGSAFICNHSSTVTNTSTRVLLYQDAFPGLGSFTLIEPPSNTFFFGRFCLTSSIAAPKKVLLMAQGMTSDTTLKITGFPTWSSWTPFANTAPEGYCAARGQDGRIGISYISNEDSRSVYFIQSTDNGLSFSTPLKIFQAVFFGTGADSLSAFRGLAIAYKGNVPCVTFETIKLEPVTFTYYPKAPAKIRFWCDELPGSDPNRSIAIASQANVPIPSPDSIMTGVNDQLGSLSRPVIGVSSDNNSILVVFQAFTNKWGGIPPDTSNYKALYITKATGNYNFSKPFKFTPDTPLKDWSFPSISSWNDKTSQNLYANVCALRDSIPGTYVNATNNGQSWAQLYYIRLATNHTIGISENTNGELNYTLYQNYPNPFNPSTKIRFEVPLNKGGAGVVSLQVFDILGKEVATLVNENLSPGTYEVKWNAENFPGGIYFYQLISENFIETKKMLLIK